MGGSGIILFLNADPDPASADYLKEEMDPDPCKQIIFKGLDSKGLFFCTIREHIMRAQGKRQVLRKVKGDHLGNFDNLYQL